MDYNRPLNVSTDNPKVHIALAMIPGVEHGKTGKYSASPLLINPGGPGVPGASFALGVGGILQSVVSSDKSQDIIGFDPRGIGATTPQASCWSYPSSGKEVMDEDLRTGAFNQMICTICAVFVMAFSDITDDQYRDFTRHRTSACERHGDCTGSARLTSTGCGQAAREHTCSCTRHVVHHKCLG
jgi:hypothetical protein